MLKIRLMGTKNDIKWFGKILQRNPKSNRVFRFVPEQGNQEIS